MEATPVVGRQARMLNDLGAKLAEQTRHQAAPNQGVTERMPPEMAPEPSGRSNKDGTPQMSYGKRLMGANSIQLRMDAEARGVSDTRYSTEKRANWTNKSWNKGNQDTVRGVNPVTKAKPEPVTLSSYKATAVRVVHQADGKGFGATGEKGGMIDVKAGDPVYAANGKQASDTHELRDTYKVYHVSDLNIAELRPRTPPNNSDRALSQQNEEFGAQLKAAGQPVREPTRDERDALVVPKEVGKVLYDVERHHEVKVVQKVDSLDDASFRVKAGVPTIEVPPGTKFQDVHEQATSVLKAVAHAHIYSAAKTQVAQATERGEVNEPAQARVAAYEAPRPTRAKSEEFQKAELAASYATVNRVTAIPATYVAPVTATVPETCERWAQQLEKPGGMAEVSRDITSVEVSFKTDRDSTNREMRQERTQERNQAQQEEQQAAHAQKPVQPGGDPGGRDSRGAPGGWRRRAGADSRADAGPESARPLELSCFAGLD